MKASIKIVLGLALPLLGGCAADRQVFVPLPITRLELPEAAPRTFGLGVASGSIVKLELTPDQTTTTPATAAPPASTHQQSLLRFDAQLSPRVTLSAKAYGEGLNGGQLKFALARPQTPRDAASLALTLAYAKGNHNFDFDGGGDDSHTNVDQSLRDAALIFGLRLSPEIQLFGGPYFSKTLYRGDYRSARGSNPDVSSSFRGEARLRGFNIGLGFQFPGSLRLLAEYSRADVEAGATEESLGRGSVVLESHFGARTFRRQ